MNGTRLLVFGHGYTGAAIAREAAATGGMHPALVSRDPARAAAPDGVDLIAFADAAQAIATATHIVATAAPPTEGDPVLAAHGGAIREAPNLRWAGYISTTGVYGDRGGAWVDEDTPPAPGQERSRRRVAAEEQWAAFAGRIAVDLFRTAGIYGPGRSPLDDVRAGRARLVVKPGQSFGRIHVEDIARAVIAAARQERPPGRRVLHLADEEPAENAAVVAEAARLLGAPSPPQVPFEQAVANMGEMGRSFWAENRRVASRKTRDALGIEWRYPTYREGLRAILERR